MITELDRKSEIENELITKKMFYITPEEDKALEIKSKLETLEISNIIRCALNLYLEDILNAIENNNKIALNIKKVVKCPEDKNLIKKGCRITQNQHIALMLKMTLNYGTDMSYHVRKALDIYLKDILKTLDSISPDDKKAAWDFAIDLQAIDNRTPSDELLKLAEQEQKGNITDDDILISLNKKYEKLGVHNA